MVMLIWLEIISLKWKKENKLKSERKISQKKKLKFKLLFQSFHAKRLKGSECLDMTLFQKENSNSTTAVVVPWLEAPISWERVKQFSTIPITSEDMI